MKMALNAAMKKRRSDQLLRSLSKKSWEVSDGPQAL